MTRRSNRPKRPNKPRKPRKPRKPKRSSRRQKPLLEEISQHELEEIVQRAKAALSEEEHGKLKAAVDTLSYLTQALEAKGASIRRLRKLLFGASTEKTSQVLGDDGSKEDSGVQGPPGEGDGAAGGSEQQEADGETDNKKKRKGHGRSGAKDYVGADKIKVPHETLSRGDRCPECQRGKLYPMAEPAVMVRVRGMAPLRATVYERQRLRCNLCGQVFVARAPAGVGGAKYDETAASMIGLLKYGCGLPFNRLERLERDLGIPLPASTQWEVVHEAATKLDSAYQELIRQAAQGQVLHNDDTTMKILAILAGGEGPGEALDDSDSERTGVYTSGIVSVADGHKVALFFTGRRHAGENLERVLARRASELPVPIQMCDGLSHNTAGDFETVVANCMAHARRKFVDVADSFPEQVRHVLLQLRQVYNNDAHARAQQKTPQQRLALHQAHSGPVMEDLKAWLETQFEDKLVEPNSTLGEAIAYMLKHWKALTLFLRVAGAPLDNNIVERALKKAILHRKNALFYKTENGAGTGDLYMSLIHTCELCGADPFDYLVALQRHDDQVAEAPADWMPWNYKETLDSLASTP